jgi:hypothetical protein
MQPDLESTIAIHPSEKPILNSYDSAEECSFYHWIELCRLVDESDVLEIEETEEAVVSEV